MTNPVIRSMPPRMGIVSRIKMSWRISTVHSSTDRYEEPVTTSYNEVRGSRRVGRWPTRCLSESVTVRPQTSLYRYVDYFSPTSIFLRHPRCSHSELVVVGRSGRRHGDSATASRRG